MTAVSLGLAAVLAFQVAIQAWRLDRLSGRVARLEWILRGAAQEHEDAGK